MLTFFTSALTQHRHVRVHTHTHKHKSTGKSLAITQQSLLHLAREQVLSTLTVPTGGGRSSLRLKAALGPCQSHPRQTAGRHCVVPGTAEAGPAMLCDLTAKGMALQPA